MQNALLEYQDGQHLQRANVNAEEIGRISTQNDLLVDNLNRLQSDVVVAEHAAEVADDAAYAAKVKYETLESRYETLESKYEKMVSTYVKFRQDAQRPKPAQRPQPVLANKTGTFSTLDALALGQHWGDSSSSEDDA